MDPDSLGTLDKSELIALFLAQAEQIRVLITQNAALTARVAALEAKLNIPPKTPDNSSLPPSSGQKANRPDAAKPPRKSRPGVTRALCPDPDQVRDIYAKQCNGCGARLSEACSASIKVRARVNQDETAPLLP